MISSKAHLLFTKYFPNVVAARNSIESNFYPGTLCGISAVVVSGVEKKPESPPISIQLAPRLEKEVRENYDDRVLLVEMSKNVDAKELLELMKLIGKEVLSDLYLYEARGTWFLQLNDLNNLRLVHLQELLSHDRRPTLNFIKISACPNLVITEASFPDSVKCLDLSGVAGSWPACEQTRILKVRKLNAAPQTGHLVLFFHNRLREIDLNKVDLSQAEVTKTRIGGNEDSLTSLKLVDCGLNAEKLAVIIAGGTEKAFEARRLIKLEVSFNRTLSGKPDKLLEFIPTHSLRFPAQHHLPRSQTPLAVRHLRYQQRPISHSRLRAEH